MDHEGPESTTSSGHGKTKGTGRSSLLDEYSKTHRQMVSCTELVSGSCPCKHRINGWPMMGSRGKLKPGKRIISLAGYDADMN